MNELENLMYAIGTQLYDKDRILYDIFDERFNHKYVTFSYCSTELDKIEQLKVISNLKENFTIIELWNKAMMKSDYYNLHRLKWIISNYKNKIEKYKINKIQIINEEDIKESFNNRIKQLKELNLDDWRKSNDKHYYYHYYWWLNHLLEDENYALWILEYNATNIFDMFHVSNYGDKRFSKILIQYIIDNNIIPDPMWDSDINLVNPFCGKNMYNGYKISASGNMGGFWYKVYLTAKELQEIYKIMGEENARDMGITPFFGYINALNGNHEKDIFYLYFEQ